MLWNLLFSITTLLMLGSALAALFSRQAMYGALYLVISMISVAMLYYLLGAPFISALQVIVYVGAIAVLLVFMVTMLHRPGQQSRGQRRRLALPLLMLVLLFGEAVVLFTQHLPAGGEQVVAISPRVVGQTLFGHYLLLVEATALLLLAALTAVLHLSRKSEEED